MLRVITGSARNLKLVAPEGLETRPTTDRIKETLFNMLQNDIYGTVVIDMFAGSGQIGIESLSRGAKKCYFIDNSPNAIKCITENVKHTHFEPISTILNKDAYGALNAINESHVDILFMDPPYNKGIEKDILNTLRNIKYVDSETLIIVEAELHTDFDYLDEFGYELIKEKKYKSNKHMFIRKKEQ